MNSKMSWEDIKATAAYTLVNVLYYGVYAFVFLYLSPYLLANGFDNTEIGMVMAVGFIIAVFLQQIIANFVDKTGFRVSRILQAGFLLLILMSAILLRLHGRNMLICILYCAQIVIIMSIQPCLNALNFRMQNYQYNMNYGMARSMGSVSYAVISALIGQFIDMTGYALLQWGVIVGSAVFVILTLALDFHLDKTKADRKIVQKKADIDKVSYIQFIMQYRSFMLFILGCILMYFSFTTLNNFLYQAMVPLGATSADYGRVQGLKSGVELVPMMLAYTVVKKFGINKVLIFSAFSFFIKGFLTFIAGNVFQIYIATLFQMTSYGLYLPVTVYMVAELFDRGDAVKGQALLTMAYAIACVIASAVGGTVLDMFGPKFLLGLTSGFALLGAVIVTISLPIIDRTIEKKNRMFG